jgi:hypothetical protein
MPLLQGFSTPRTEKVRVLAITGRSTVNETALRHLSLAGSAL